MSRQPQCRHLFPSPRNLGARPAFHTSLAYRLLCSLPAEPLPDGPTYSALVAPVQALIVLSLARSADRVPFGCPPMDHGLLVAPAALRLGAMIPAIASVAKGLVIARSVHGDYPQPAALGADALRFVIPVIAPCAHRASNRGPPDDWADHPVLDSHRFGSDPAVACVADGPAILDGRRGRPHASAQCAPPVGQVVPGVALSADWAFIEQAGIRRRHSTAQATDVPRFVSAVVALPADWFARRRPEYHRARRAAIVAFLDRRVVATMSYGHAVGSNEMDARALSTDYACAETLCVRAPAAVYAQKGVAGDLALCVAPRAEVTDAPYPAACAPVSLASCALLNRL